MNVLIADDNQNHLVDMTAIVEEICPNAKVSNASSYASALDLIHTWQDILIVDARLSGDQAGIEWQGFSVAAKGQAVNPELSVILVSAFFRETQEQNACSNDLQVLEKGPDWLDRLEVICRDLSDAHRHPSVVLSYSHTDEAAVRPLYEELRGKGVEPWWDKDIDPGDSWEDTIRKKIYEADFFLACLSENSTEREGMIQKELRWALGKAEEKPPGKVFIIPAKLTEHCQVPEPLDRYQAVELYRANGVSNLLRVLKRRLNS